MMFDCVEITCKISNGEGRIYDGTSLWDDTICQKYRNSRNERPFKILEFFTIRTTKKTVKKNETTEISGDFEKVRLKKATKSATSTIFLSFFKF